MAIARRKGDPTSSLEGLDGNFDGQPFLFLKKKFLTIYKTNINKYVHPSIHLSMHPSTSLSMAHLSPFTHPSVCPSIHLPIYPSTCLERSGLLGRACGPVAFMGRMTCLPGLGRQSHPLAWGRGPVLACGSIYTWMEASLAVDWMTPQSQDGVHGPEPTVSV